MDEANQDPFRCSICLELVRDPVTIPCGHNYCMKCINGCWNREGQKGEYSCPQCRETFTPRPVLKKNTMLAELVDKMTNSAFQTASPPPATYAEPGDVECDFCSERKVKAVQSCLVCLISLCQTHIEPHYSIPALKKHKLVHASTHLQQKICSKHDKVTEVFCRTDKKCICMLCIMDEHKGHDTVSAAAERKERQKELGKTRAEYLKRIQKREKELQELQDAVASYQRSAQETEEHSDKIFTELLDCIERRWSEVKDVSRAQQKAAVKDAEDVLEKLEQELAELRREDAELEKLSLEEDHVHFLQSFQALQSSEFEDSPSISLSPQMSFEAVGKSLSALKSEVTELCKQNMMKISEEGKSYLSEQTVASFDFLRLNTVLLFISLVTSVKILLTQEPNTREEFLKYSCRLTLDPNTAHRLISLSEGNRRATRGKEQPYPDHPDRFQFSPQVLCEQGFYGRLYWEAELDLKKDSAVCIAVAYKSITKGKSKAECNFGKTSWCLQCKIGESIFWHQCKKTCISVIPTSRIGVYLDHMAGTLAFYNVSDTMTLLHKVKTTFTEPLYPGFWVGNDASVKLCSKQ
ncbi:hypothetical protein ACEWY4_016467 [Coilia grayii]|uniref:Tripartite motif-containing protein 16-like n=1 Tax=Coilia grayii TaxID=363190 RepID=A0ABD1JLF0_9TELE